MGELSRQIRGCLESRFRVVTVRGEVGQLSRPRSGHLYFSLLDDTCSASARFASAQIPAVMWRSEALSLKFDLRPGMRVLIQGRIGVYEARGNYQVLVDRLMPEGVGDLQIAFEQLKERLRGEGLFDAARKQALPFLPRRIGVVTSPTGAALRDFLRGLFQRHPAAWVRMVPVRVQGEGAALEIAEAIRQLHGPEPQVDVIVLTRGGGSLEDLWAFNEEPVARALAASSIPCVSAVGHEVDYTIADFVADGRASTPTAAAELVVPSLSDLHGRLDASRLRLVVGLRAALERGRRRLDQVASHELFHNPQALLRQRLELIDHGSEELQNSLYKHWRRWNDVWRERASRLRGVSPLNVLSRGYSIVTREEDGIVVRSSEEVTEGDFLSVRAAEGEYRVVVEPGSVRGPAADSVSDSLSGESDIQDT